MGYLDDILDSIDNSMYNDTYGDMYDDYLPRPEIKSDKSKITTLIRSGKIDKDTDFAFSYGGNTYDSLADMAYELNFDIDTLLINVRGGMTFSGALAKAQEYGNYSSIVDTIKFRRDKAIKEAKDMEERRKSNMLQEDINRLLCALNRAVAVSGLTEHINLLGLCRKDFLKLYALSLHDGDVLDVRNLRDTPRCDTSQFVLALEEFISDVKKLGIVTSKEDLLHAFYKAMWVDGIPHDDESIKKFVSDNIDKELYDIISERERVIISLATCDRVYNYIERNYKSFSTSSPIKHKTCDGWLADLSSIIKMPVAYVKYLIGNGVSVDKLAVCQKLQYIVQLDEGIIKCWGIMKLEHYFDIVIDDFLNNFSIDNINLTAPVNVTELVAKHSGMHLTTFTDSLGRRERMTLFHFYNRVGYGEDGVIYMAGELEKKPDMVLS